MKKLLVIILGFAVVIAVLYGSYQVIRNKEPKQTGGSRLDVAPPEYYTELKAMEKLNSELPLSVGSIEITFDYSQGKYIVTSDPGIDTESEFVNWYSSEPYRRISRDRFLVK